MGATLLSRIEIGFPGWCSGDLWPLPYVSGQNIVQSSEGKLRLQL